MIVASYNIHRCIGLDGHRDPVRTARVIQALNADVVALQEVEAWPVPGSAEMQIDFLAHLVGLQAIHGPTVERLTGHYGNALLTRLPVLAVRKLSLAVHGRQPRGALDVDLDAGGVTVRVIATHLGLRPGERRQQVRLILNALASQRPARDVVTVLLGDINEWFVAGRPLRWLHAHFGQTPARRTWPSFLPLFALDRIWVRPGPALRGFEVVRTAESRRASDHLPVRAQVDTAVDTTLSGR